MSALGHSRTSDCEPKIKIDLLLPKRRHLAATQYLARRYELTASGAVRRWLWLAGLAYRPMSAIAPISTKKSAAPRMQRWANERHCIVQKKRRPPGEAASVFRHYCGTPWTTKDRNFAYLSPIFRAYLVWWEITHPCGTCARSRPSLLASAPISPYEILSKFEKDSKAASAA